MNHGRLYSVLTSCLSWVGGGGTQEQIHALNLPHPSSVEIQEGPWVSQAHEGETEEVSLARRPSGGREQEILAQD